eukprot:CAMPEP_0184696288 /NCGR_PEP_ID=MMETSP0313-20130426/3632_1 /TAXON_ID=2792 /ORGANISM="Porphyridium aerugineum, Strain SAG 1380-2" /LENGTH=331 /DNA_ID=CAMNT_0027154885 /DNA_START=82 /DNA_END=1077 /DNA_ORIENTATION=+
MPPPSAIVRTLAELLILGAGIAASYIFISNNMLDIKRFDVVRWSLWLATFLEASFLPLWIHIYQVISRRDHDYTPITIEIPANPDNPQASRRQAPPPPPPSPPPSQLLSVWISILILWSGGPLASLFIFFYDLLVHRILGPALSPILLLFVSVFLLISGSVFHKRVVVSWWDKIHREAKPNSWLKQPLRPAAVAGMKIEREKRLKEAEPIKVKLIDYRQRRAIARERYNKVKEKSGQDIKLAKGLVAAYKSQINASVVPGESEAQSMERKAELLDFLHQFENNVVEKMEDAQDERELSYDSLLYELNGTVEDIARKYDELVSMSQWNTTYR